MKNEKLVTGKITFDDGVSFNDATVYIRLENVSMMDAPAGVIAEQVIKNTTYDGNPIPFELLGNVSADDRERFNVRVHVSMDGSSEFQKGDFITKRSYTVPNGRARDLVVKVDKI